MGEGVGKMFGIDKIFGGLLDSIGLGALKPLVNIALDFATGNIPGVLQDLTHSVLCRQLYDYSLAGSGRFGASMISDSKT